MCRSGYLPTRPDASVDPPTFTAELAGSAAHQTLARLHAALPGVPVIIKILVGEPAPVLIAEASGAAMLVIGSRHRRVGRRPGSIGPAVLENAQCPVAIVRAAHAAATPTEDARRDAAQRAPVGP